jgi:hypothetical protein
MNIQRMILVLELAETCLSETIDREDELRREICRTGHPAKLKQLHQEREALCDELRKWHQQAGVSPSELLSRVRNLIGKFRKADSEPQGTGLTLGFMKTMRLGPEDFRDPPPERKSK